MTPTDIDLGKALGLVMAVTAGTTLILDGLLDARRAKRKGGAK